jgi:hypothetical protein
MAANLLTRDEARRIANIAKLANVSAVERAGVSSLNAGPRIRTSFEQGKDIGGESKGSALIMSLSADVMKSDLRTAFGPPFLHLNPRLNDGA